MTSVNACWSQWVRWVALIGCICVCSISCGSCDGGRFISSLNSDGGQSGDVSSTDSAPNNGGSDARTDGGGQSGQSCGDNRCSGIEDCRSCPEDCPCSASCNDGLCSTQDGETCRNCPDDCGSCQVECGDGVCWGTESCATCPGDCGYCAASCQDGQCQDNETPQNCPYDCGFPQPVCGDASCNGVEDCETCPDDCGQCSATCSPDACGDGENCRNCPSGCGPCTGCGDGACYSPESCLTCQPDCGPCLGGDCGDGDCKDGETPENCPYDCGYSHTVCGDGICNGTEDCLSCELDCPCASDDTCPDGQCYLESCRDCPQDCDSCAPRCGDQDCQPGEQPCACLADCGSCPQQTCGDGTCALGETPGTCPSDCKDTLPADCGDGLCHATESCVSCASDCGDAQCQQSCGNNSCDPNEDCSICPEDCGVCTDPQRNNGRCEEGETCETDPYDCGWCVRLPQWPPDTQCTGAIDEDGGRVCGNLDEAWTGDADNVGYYPFSVMEGRTVRVISGFEGGTNNPKEVLATLSGGDRFAAQSMRNPGCSDNPPLRRYEDRGYIFGYVPATGVYGWVVPNSLRFEGYNVGQTQCVSGPNAQANRNFQVRRNPYDNCRRMPCDDSSSRHFNQCDSANPPSEGIGDCGGHRVQGEEIRYAGKLTTMRYSPGGSARRYLNVDDRVKLLYITANESWAFVEVTETCCAPLTKVGHRGWVLLDQLCEDGEPCEFCEDDDGDGRGPSCDLGSDCDDSDPSVYDGAREACDGKDNDCNGMVDDSPKCAKECVEDRFEPDNRSVNGNRLTQPGTLEGLVACADCPNYDADWFDLGRGNSSVTIELSHSTGTNQDGERHADLDVEFYCGSTFCDSIRGSSGTTSGTFNTRCADGSSCSSSAHWTLMVYTRCSTHGSPTRGTPYSITRQ